MVITKVSLSSDKSIAFVDVRWPIGVMDGRAAHGWDIDKLRDYVHSLELPYYQHVNTMRELEIIEAEYVESLKPKPLFSWRDAVVWAAVAILILYFQWEFF